VTRVAALAFGVGLALLGSAGAATTATPGVTATTVLLGSTGPLAEPGGVLRGAEAYFRYVNARGGVNGRRIVFGSTTTTATRRRRRRTRAG
jgi:branched-chain amino acid transport system substrate-binding protein